MGKEGKPTPDKEDTVPSGATLDVNAPVDPLADTQQPRDIHGDTQDLAERKATEWIQGHPPTGGRTIATDMNTAIERIHAEAREKVLGKSSDDLPPKPTILPEEK